MIDKSKTYRTRDGREVRIYATDGAAPYPVHGAVKNSDGEWCGSAWLANGSYKLNSPIFDENDLIEVKPRIKRTVWVNVYRHDDGAEFVELHDRRDQADGSGGTARVACVKLTIDCEEGEGL